MGIPPAPLHPPVVVAPVIEPDAPPLISSSPANQATAGVSFSGASGGVIIILWLLSLWHVTVPQEVALAASPIVGAGVHWLMMKFATPNPG